jgi:hypothetical protein
MFKYYYKIIQIQVIVIQIRTYEQNLPCNSRQYELVQLKQNSILGFSISNKNFIWKSRYIKSKQIKTLYYTR